MSFDAVVIGAGVIGAAVAYELGRDGMRVLTVDRGAGWHRLDQRVLGPRSPMPTGMD